VDRLASEFRGALEHSDADERMAADRLHALHALVVGRYGWRRIGDAGGGE
jgi:hypothetical protein